MGSIGIIRHLLLKIWENVTSIFLIFGELSCMRSSRLVLCYCHMQYKDLWLNSQEGQFQFNIKNFLTQCHLIEQAPCEVMTLPIIRNL